MHIHVINADCEAKFWLEPEVELAANHGFSSKEISKITHLVIKYGDEFKQKFAAHIGKRIND